MTAAPSAVRQIVIVPGAGPGPAVGLEEWVAGLDGARHCARAGAEPGEWPEGVQLVVDGREDADYATARAALERGAHYLGTAGARAHVVGAEAQLGELAASAGRVALFGAGLLPGVLDPLVRSGTDDLRRVNEVLVGVVPGTQRFGNFGSARLIESIGTRIPMLLGGERTEREALGDERWFEHPAPAGPVRSVNVDAADLELYTSKPVKATSVRVSLGWNTSAEARLFKRARSFVPRGWFGGAAGAARRLDKLAAARGGPARVTLIVRGIDAAQLPQERRVSLSQNDGLGRLSGAGLRVLVRRLCAEPGADPGVGGALEPGAGAAVGRIDAEDLCAELESGGATIVRGDLGGWRGAHA